MSTEPKAETPAPQKRISKQRQQEELIASLTAEIDKMRSRIKSQQDTIVEYERTQRNQVQAIQDQSAKLGRALEVLRPIYENTRAWEGQWPHDSICLTKKLTFGMLRRAREAFTELK